MAEKTQYEELMRQLSAIGCVKRELGRILPDGCSSGVDRAAELSRGGNAVVRHLDYDGWELLARYQDGQLLARYGEDDADRLARATRAPRGARRDAFAPFMADIGLGRYRVDEDGPFLPPTVELACLAPGCAPGARTSRAATPEHCSVRGDTWLRATVTGRPEAARPAGPRGGPCGSGVGSGLFHLVADAAVGESRLPVGPSPKLISGRAAGARATATRCC